jgi:hypothetical protein
MGWNTQSWVWIPLLMHTTLCLSTYHIFSISWGLRYLTATFYSLSRLLQLFQAYSGGLDRSECPTVITTASLLYCEAWASLGICLADEAGFEMMVRKISRLRSRLAWHKYSSLAYPFSFINLRYLTSRLVSRVNTSGTYCWRPTATHLFTNPIWSTCSSNMSSPIHQHI